jgi:hypothetical protein
VLDRAGTGAPAVGIPVVFVDTDGSQIVVASDSNGKAEAEVFGGASVTSVQTVSNGKQMLTVLDVAPGDDIVLGNTPQDTSNAGNFVVNWTQLGGATSYEVYGPCGFMGSAGTGATSLTITLKNNCNPATMELLVQARNSSNATIGFSAKANVSVAAGNTTMGAFVGGLGFTASYTNLSRANTLNMTRRMPDGFGFSLSAASQDVTGVTTTTASVTPPTTGTARVDSNFQTTTFESQDIRQRLAGSATTYGLDFAATALPWINKPMLDVAAHTINISADATGTSGDTPDLVQSQLSWRRGSTSFGWVTFGGKIETIVLPVLEGALADGMPAVGDTLTGNRVTVFDADTIADYAALRNNIGKALDQTLDDAPGSAAALVRVSTSAGGN